MSYRTEDQHAHYLAGGRDALAFKAGSHLLYQDVFKAETADHKIRVSYDDVEGCCYLDVTFKHRRANPITCTYSNAREAIERAIRFVAEHPAPMPRCDVDY